MVRALRSERTDELLSDWGSLLEGAGVDARATSGPTAARPIGEVAGGRIRKVYRRMLKMGGAIDDASPAESYHELRKKGKELRYMLELFGAPLYPAEVVKPMIKALKALQDVLGRHQDREVQIALLRSLGPARSRGCGAGRGADGDGGADRRGSGEDERAARAEFAGRFAAFCLRGQRRLVNETFA